MIVQMGFTPKAIGKRFPGNYSETARTIAVLLIRLTEQQLNNESEKSYLRVLALNVRAHLKKQI